ncbi:MFS transporter [Actinomarinicola tropica]|uniref:MFS transporter n=1 Tax=Actinomarinicola tropica TaxID=2789776 RepID=UPI001E310615|nr:MFS transporter [Actinomarinicola tropica]
MEDRGAAAGEPHEPPTAGSDAPTTAPPTWRESTFAALSVPAYRLLWYGGVFSFLAVQMQVIARAALAYDLTGSNESLGTVMFWFGVPMLLLTPFGGVAADRFSKRAVILVSQWLLIISSALLAIVLIADVIAFWMLPASSAVQAAAFAFLGPARMAFTSDLVGRQRLGNAVVLQQMSMNGTRVFGPSIAGLLTSIAWFGYEGAYITTAILTIVASVMTMRLPPGSPAPGKVTQRPLREFADGLRYVRANPHVGLLLVVSLVVVMSAFPYISFLASLSKDVFGFGESNAGYGFMSGATAIGAVSASLFIAGRSGGPGVWKVQAAAGAAFGIGLVLLAAAPTFLVSLVVLVLVGGATSAFQALNNTMVLMASESAYHGRVQSLMMLGFSGFGLMALPLGVVADAIGLRTTFAIMGTVTTVAMGVYFVVRPILERSHPMVVHDE